MPVYFAFGSNMDDEQMARRCPGSSSIALATLPEHRLVFRGPSQNRGAGVASVDPAPQQEVVGLLWELSEADIVTLDRLEGAPHWYKRVTADVVLGDGATLEAILYRLPTEVLEMAPTDDYYDQIAAASLHLELELSSLEDALARSQRAEQARDNSG